MIDHVEDHFYDHVDLFYAIMPTAEDSFVFYARPYTHLVRSDFGSMHQPVE